MIGAHKKATTFAAASILAGALALTPAQAADLGGNCCADLEERVAELEATTVRKGNRKVSLQISGHVNKALLFWDDGEDSDVYVVDNETSSTRIRFVGNAKIKPGWTAGYKIEFSLLEDSSDGVNANNDDVAFKLQHRHADIWVKSQYGKFSLGQGDMASNGTSEVDLSGTDVVSYSGFVDIGGGFTFRNSGGVKLIDAYSSLDGLSRANRVRYDTPSLAGFIVSTSWGEDDMWDVALRFKKQVSNFQIAAAVAYSENEDEGNDTERVNGSISLAHIPSGINLTFAAGDQETAEEDSGTFYYAKLGIKRRWSSLGTTAISADYGYGEDFVTGNTEVTHWGVQVVQNIDAAAMQVYAGWSHNEMDRDGYNNVEDLDFFLVGSRIKF